jgi:hypothetical protein
VVPLAGEPLVTSQRRCGCCRRGGRDGCRTEQADRQEGGGAAPGGDGRTPGSVVDARLPDRPGRAQGATTGETGTRPHGRSASMAARYRLGGYHWQLAATLDLFTAVGGSRCSWCRRRRRRTSRRTRRRRLPARTSGQRRWTDRPRQARPTRPRRDDGGPGETAAQGRKADGDALAANPALRTPRGVSSRPSRAMRSQAPGSEVLWPLVPACPSLSSGWLPQRLPASGPGDLKVAVATCGVPECHAPPLTSGDRRVPMLWHDHLVSLTCCI